MPSDHPVTHPRWISYVRVADMTTTVNNATTMGATVIVPPHQERNGGTIAILADPAGALFGLLQWADNPDTGLTNQPSTAGATP
jgi:predicted enzyme related to lactoylglutathione lyase